MRTTTCGHGLRRPTYVFKPRSALCNVRKAALILVMSLTYCVTVFLEYFQVNLKYFRREKCAGSDACNSSSDYCYLESSRSTQVHIGLCTAFQSASHPQRADRVNSVLLKLELRPNNTLSTVRQVTRYTVQPRSRSFRSHVFKIKLCQNDRGRTVIKVAYHLIISLISLRSICS